MKQIALVTSLMLMLLFASFGSHAQQVSPPKSLDLAAAQHLKFLFHPFCFTGNRLPVGDFEDPAQAQTVFGLHTVNVTYYDSLCNQVKSAEKPGRYTAIVEIHPQTGMPIKRYYTLFRFASDSDWERAKLQAKIEFPEKTQAEKEKPETIREFFRRRLVDSPERSPDSVIQLAWLNEVGSGVRATDRTGPVASNYKWVHDLKLKTGNLVPLQYHIRMPEGADKDPGKKLPLIIFLHGAGGNVMKDWPLIPFEIYANAHKDFPFIVVSFQFTDGGTWNTHIPEMDDLFDEIVAKYPIDRDRVYLTGQSMGGMGCWRWATEHPDRFAAVVPICGVGDPQDVDRIKDIPIWDFHGAKDPTVPVQMSYDMVDALKKVNGRVRMTIYPEAEHDSWTQAYNTDELYSWMLKQTRGKPDEPRWTEGNPIDPQPTGKVVDTVAPPDPAPVQALQSQHLKFVFHPFCFSGKSLPSGDFENPAQARSVLGPYTVNVKYYDSLCNPVKSSEKPGLYSAVVEIDQRTGPPTKRFYTLVRTESGSDTETAEEQSEITRKFDMWRIADNFDHSSDSVIQLAWRTDVGHGVRVTDRTGPIAWHYKWLHDLKQKTGNLAPLHYYIHMPKGVDKDTARKLPTIIFLHGAGERGRDAAGLEYSSPVVRYVTKHKDLPFIVIAPQCPADDWWNGLIPSLDDFFDEIVAKYPIDRDRIYLTGQSMGGLGSWRWATEHPDRFAAVVPVCGAGDPKDVDRIKNVPIWDFHGGKDSTVPVQMSYDMVNALRKVNGRVKLTIYPEAGHNSWDQAYDTEELYSWMLKQAKGRPEQARTSEADAN